MDLNPTAHGDHSSIIVISLVSGRNSCLEDKPYGASDHNVPNTNKMKKSELHRRKLPIFSLSLRLLGRSSEYAGCLSGTNYRIGMC